MLITVTWQSSRSLNLYPKITISKLRPTGRSFIIFGSPASLFLRARRRKCASVKTLDISITALESDSINTIHNKINIIINNFPDTIFPLQLNNITEFRLIFSKYEIFSNEDEYINSESTYVMSNCLICSITPPNVLFCNCGHLVVCENCYRNYNKKQCVSCRMLNTIVRIIE